MNKTLSGRCPQCNGIAVLNSANRFRPFCSERCKLLDFGAWIDGRYTIPAVEDDSDADDMGAEPPPRQLQ